MRKIPNIIRIGAIVSIAWFAAAALTPLTSVAIRNSTIDSTTIGATTASTVRGTTLTATARPANPLASNTSVLGWNASSGSGETDFMNDSGAAAGGFNWYATRAALGDSWSSPIMSLSAGGVLSVNTVSGMGVQAGGAYPSTTGIVNGAWLNWNQSATFGETDFVNQHATGAGGFKWFDTTSSTTPGSAIASMDNAGNLTLRSIIASSGFSGNATTATALAANPSNCGAGQYATGIQANGTADCGAIANIQTGIGSSCTTGSSSYSTCPSSVTWTTGFADAGYIMSCTIIAPSDPRAYIGGVTVKTSSGAVVSIVTGGSIPITFTRLECIAMHN